MKTGMNLLLWTTHVTEQQDAILDQIKALGFDAVEVPIFDTADLAPFERLGKRLKGLGLGTTAVTVMGPETNPISPDPKIRDAAVAHLDRVMECGQAFGCEILCGRPTPPSVSSRERGRPRTSSSMASRRSGAPPRRPRRATSGSPSNTSIGSRSTSSRRLRKRRGSSRPSIIPTAR